ncbi:hypothetical protein [Enterococcus sp. AZ007]|uniref:hypothetical protein n=1 Tax=Enterococcus sp. AZ007 TaxID=2774839 RepID=UPI003F20BDB0
MFPIKKITFFNLITNLSILVTTLISVRAGLIVVALLFLFEHGDDMIRRTRKTKDACDEISS